MNTHPTNQPELRLRETKVKAAIAALDLGALVAHLDEFTFGEAQLDELLSHVQRSNILIIPYSNARKEGRRNAFLGGLEAEVMERLGLAAAARVQLVADQLAMAEMGYRYILETLDKSEISKLQPEKRVSAALSRAAQQYGRLMEETGAAIARQRFVLPQSISLRDRESQPVSPDALLEGLVFGIGATLTMEAIKAKWVQNEIVVLPLLPPASEAERFKAGSNEMLAHCWRAWRRLEERARFLDGRITVYEASSLPAGTPDGILTLFAYEGDPGWYDFAAMARTNDQFAQNHAELVHEHGVGNLVVPLGTSISLPPMAFVSEEEAVALSALNEALGYSIRDDVALVDGLRLVEWLRGFATLSVVADVRSELRPEGTDPYLPILDDDELLKILVEVGLDAAKAAHFIDAATFRSTSRDLFDAPLLQLINRKKLLFSPAVLGQNHAMVLLSVFSKREIAFEQKGKAFEMRVLSLLRRGGLDARGFEITRDKETFEFDAVAPWDDFVFVFECKNRGLPRDQPMQIHHFTQEIRSHVTQVKRLVEALRRWPDILNKEFGRNLSGKTIVPCVLNNLPYARTGDLDGVLFYDYSALGRFFQSSQMNIKAVYNAGGGAKLLKKIGTVRIWKDDTPTAADLVAELRDPIQLRILKHHTTEGHPIFGLAEGIAATMPEFVRQDVTPMTMADFARIPRGNVRLQLERAQRRAKKLRRRATRSGPANPA
jgi:hypothetical protein